jgi:ABC-type multidrug transport system fused ATPase/permease subunit
VAADPEILILDEATASIDTETELVIQEALRTVTAGRKSILIAYRLKTIEDADRILVLQDGGSGSWARTRN